MAELFASGRLVDLILVAVVVQGLGLSLYARLTGGAVPPLPLIATLASGFFLLVALRTALVGAWWGWTGLALFAALLAHLADLRLRWR